MKRKELDERIAYNQTLNDVSYPNRVVDPLECLIDIGSACRLVYDYSTDRFYFTKGGTHD